MTAGAGVCGVMTLALPRKRVWAAVAQELIGQLPSDLWARFRLPPDRLSRIVLATDTANPAHLLQCIHRSFPHCEVSACVGVGIAAVQALWDLQNWTEANSASLGLLIAIDEKPVRESLYMGCAVVGANPELMVARQRVLFTLEGKGSESTTVEDAFTEAVDHFLRLFPATQSLFSLCDSLLLVSPDLTSEHLFFSLLLKDMIENPQRYGEIGRISRALELSNEHHCAMLRNLTGRLTKDREVPALVRFDGTGNSAVCSALEKWTEGGEGKVVIAVCHGEGLQFSVAMFQASAQRHTVRNPKL